MAADDGIVDVGLGVGLRDEGAALRAPIPLIMLVRAFALLRWNEEVGGAERGLYLCCERIAVERIVGPVLGAHVAANRQMVRHEAAEAQAATDQVLRKSYGGSWANTMCEYP